MINDKRTRADYIREIGMLKDNMKTLTIKNKKLNEKFDNLVSWVEDEMYDIDKRIDDSFKFLDESGYTLRMYLKYQKKAYKNVLKRLERF